MHELLIADDHPLYRDALAAMARRALAAVRISEASSVAELYAAVDARAYDLLLLDLGLPGAHGFSALVHLRALKPELPVLIVSGRSDPMSIRRALGYGAAGFLPKSLDAAAMVAALQNVLDGEIYDPIAVGAAPISAEERDLAAKLAELTPAQFRVLVGMCEGKLNKQIAWELSITEATVKAHVTAVLRKLKVSNRTHAVTLAAELALEPELARRVRQTEAE